MTMLALDFDKLRPSAMRAMRIALIKDIERFGATTEHQYELIGMLTMELVHNDGKLTED